MYTITEKMADAEFVASLPKTRAEAKEKGAKFYYSGPCVHGHDVYRRTVNGSCVQCQSNISLAQIAATPQDVLDRWQAKSRKAWNASEKGKTAKQRWRERDPRWAWVVSAVGGARGRAKREGIPFSLTNEYVASLLTDVCPVLGKEFVWIGAGTTHAYSPTIDRMIPELGYVEGNVSVISHRANSIKHDATVEEMQRVFEWMRSS